MKTPARGYAARPRWLKLHPAMIVAIVIVVAFGGLWVTGVIDPMHALFAPKAPSTRGLVAIPISGTAIPAYTKIVRDHLWNPKTGTFAVLYLRPDQVSPDIIRNMNGIIGRVMNHNKPANYAFTEADFLPEGTRAGLVAGIPAGKRAMRIPVEKIPGLIGLLPGDRFDLVSTLPIDAAGGGSLATSGGIYGKQLDMQARLTNWQKQATVRVVVQNGDIVEPTTTRQIPVSNSSLTQGLIIRYKPVQEVVISVAPHEVPRLTEAMAVGAEISCVPRSGRPDDPRDSITPESYPVSPYGGTVAPPSAAASASQGPSAAGGAVGNPLGAGFTQVEMISGNKRDIVATPVKR